MSNSQKIPVGHWGSADAQRQIRREKRREQPRKPFAAPKPKGKRKRQ